MQSCPSITTLWSSVQTQIEKVIGIKIVMDPKQCIPVASFSSGKNAKLLNIRLYAALLLILHAWLHSCPPNYKYGKKLLSSFPYERLSHVFQETWWVWERTVFPYHFDCEWSAIIFYWRRLRLLSLLSIECFVTLWLCSSISPFFFLPQGSFCWLHLFLWWQNGKKAMKSCFLLWICKDS